MIEYVKPSDLKKDMNETFREKFPHIKLTLSKIRRCADVTASSAVVSNHFFFIFSEMKNLSVSVTPPPLPSSSLKREMRAVSEEFGLQPVTTAMAFVYFEKLVLQGRLNKQNRKLVAAACVLLAAKISSDLRKPEVKQLIDVSLHTNRLKGRQETRNTRPRPRNTSRPSSVGFTINIPLWSPHIAETLPS